MDQVDNLHTSQMSILRYLSHHEASTFSDLQKSSGLTSDHVNFHIKKLVSGGLVKHVPKTYGKYHLTDSGKRYANSISAHRNIIERQAKLSVVISITNQQGYILRQRRLRHPYRGFWSRPTGKIKRGESVLDAARRNLQQETGIEAELTLVGLEHRLDEDANGNPLDDKYLFMVEGKNPSGELVPKTAAAENYWLTQEDYAGKTQRFGNPSSSTINVKQSPITYDEGIYIFEDDAY